METAGVVTILHIAVALPLIGWIFFHLWPRARRERFQQDLFKIRNDLFEYMWREGHSFEEPAYRDLRDTINGAIRWAEYLSIPSLVIFALLIGRGRTRESVAALRHPSDSQLCARLKKVRRQLGRRFIAYFVRTWLGAMCVFGFAVFAILKAVFVRWRFPHSFHPFSTARCKIEMRTANVCLSESRRIAANDLPLVHGGSR